MPYKIALVCVLLPLFTVHLTLTVSLLLENLEACVPYWSGCHSISATGRQYPEFFIFKGLMIPTAVFMMFYWLLLGTWLTHISDKRINPNFIVSIGCIAAVMLVVYTTTLGVVGEPYALARRIGVVFYFGFSSLGHVLLLLKLKLLDTHKLGIAPERKAIFYICIVMITSAIASAIAGFMWEGWDDWENAYEWTFSLLMISLFYVTARMWEKTAFTISLSLGKTSAS
jgi:hypothetical protein